MKFNSFEIKNYIKNNNLINLKINNYNYDFEEEVTLYQGLLQKGWYVPRFCYHVKLSLAGNCRMCFVELKNILKPVVSCTALIEKDIEVFTNSYLAFKSRENILEFILINHPIDCPVCDQGGECDLQDQYTVMGSLSSKYYEDSKKSVKNKDISFLIKLSLNKCINCSRCSRYSQSITGEYTFSLLGRGENSVISSYLKNFYLGEISGNVMDLCPVGASTSKIIAYDFRVWELNDVTFVDFTDIMHPPIRIDFRGLKIIRILPLSNGEIDEDWIGDKLRYNYKNLYKYRFYLPFIKIKNKFIKVSWNNVFLIIKNFYKKILNFFINKKLFFFKNIKFCKYTTDYYVFTFYKKYFKSLFFNISKESKKGRLIRKDFYIMNKDMDYLEVENFIFYNLNLRYEYPILNFKIREKMIFDYISIYLYGHILELNYIFKHMGNNLKNFVYFFININSKVFYQKTLLFCKVNNKYIKRLFKILGLEVINLNVLSNFKLLNFEFSGFYSLKVNKFKNIFINNYVKNNKDIFSSNNFVNKFNIYFSQNTYNLKNYFIIIPRKFNFEQNSIYLNIFGLFNDFTYLTYKLDYKTLKNDWDYLHSLINVLYFSKKIKLSNVRHKIFSKKWKYNQINLRLTTNLKVESFYHIPFIIQKKNSLRSKTLIFFSDIYSKCGVIYNVYKNLKKENMFSLFLNIDSYHWIF